MESYSQINKTGAFNTACSGVGYKFHEEINRQVNKTDNYLAKKKAGVYVPMLPYYMSTRSWTQHPGPTNANTNVRWAQSDFWSCHGGGWPLPEHYAAEAQANAITAAFGQMSKLQTSSIGIAIAEGRQTIGLIAKTVDRLAKTMLYLKRGRVKKAVAELGLLKNKTVLPWKLQKLYKVKSMRQYVRAKERRNQVIRRRNLGSVNAVADSASGTWLELHFGWKPLLSDIHEGAETLANMFYATNPPKFRFTGFGKATGSDHSGLFYQRAAGTVQNLAECRVIIYYEINDWVKYTQNTFGIANPAAIAWEVVPFSFVVDWVWPLGNYMNAISAKRGLKYIDGCRSTKLSGMATGYYAGHYGNYPTTCTSVVKSFERQAPYNLPALPQIPDTNFGNMIDAWKITTSAALLKTVFSKKGWEKLRI